MAANLQFRPCEPGDAAALAAVLREGDRREIAALGITDVEWALRQSVASSTYARTALTNGKMACIFGVSPRSIVYGIGSPWMLGSDEVTRYGFTFVREVGRQLQGMLKVYPILENWVHAENAPAVRWLRRAGFTLEPAAPYGVNGAPFHHFYMRAS